jgi:Helix-turn-helix.
MNTRLQQFLSAENISQAQFAETIGVARASVSHILAGRNKPGFDFLESMVRHYPSLNFEWLLTGHGRMYNTTKSASDATIEPVSPLSTGTQDSLFPDAGYCQENPPISPLSHPDTYTKGKDNNAQDISNQKKISKLVIFYSDGTFQEIE